MESGRQAVGIRRGVQFAHRDVDLVLRKKDQDASMKIDPGDWSSRRRCRRMRMGRSRVERSLRRTAAWTLPNGSHQTVLVA